MHLLIETTPPNHFLPAKPKRELNFVLTIDDKCSFQCLRCSIICFEEKDFQTFSKTSYLKNVSNNYPLHKILYQNETVSNCRQTMNMKSVLYFLHQFSKKKQCIINLFKKLLKKTLKQQFFTTLPKNLDFFFLIYNHLHTYTYSSRCCYNSCYF